MRRLDYLTRRFIINVVIIYHLAREQRLSMTIRITHPTIIVWRSIYGLVMTIGILWFILQAILQPKTNEQIAWVTVIEILVFIVLISFWWSQNDMD
jgi:hypothetical protein